MRHSQVRNSYNLWIKFEAGALPKLKMLQISGCRKVQWLPLGLPAGDDPWVSSIDAGAMPNLETLHIGDCYELHNMSFGCGAMPKLEAIRFEWCKYLRALTFELGVTPKVDTLKIIECHPLNLIALSGLQHLNLRSNVFE